MLLHNTNNPQTAKPRKAFISYCHADENLKDILLLALRQLEQEALIQSWHDRMLLPGQDWDRVINSQLNIADLILFFVSQSFLESTYCRDIEVTRALERESRRQAFVIPVILAECNWKKAPFAHLLAVPKDGKPLSERGIPDAGLIKDVVEQIRLALLGLWTYSEDKTVGATMESQSEVCAHPEADITETCVEIIEATQDYIPPLIKGVMIRKSGALDFIIDSGRSGVQQDFLLSHTERLKDYFREALCIREDDIWVNLSAYESNRMLPPVLSGTAIGRQMLEFDVQLKTFGASLLHPDTETGKSYWRELYNRARHRFGSSKFQYRSFQKVWVIASRAKVLERTPECPNSNDDVPQAIRDTGWMPGDSFGFVTKAELKSFCEEDTYAIEHNFGKASTVAIPDSGCTPTQRALNGMAVDLYKEMILPVIDHEINHGRHFAANRQMFYSLILASWLKIAAKQIPSLDEIVKASINSNDPRSFKMTVSGFKWITQARRRVEIEPEAQPHPGEMIDHVNPDDPAFRIPENREFYERYIKLFRRGIYRCAREETGDSAGEMIHRVYFSGALDFSNLCLII